jgi:hypothetical protein
MIQSQYLSLAAAFILGAVVTTLTAWWLIDQARRTVLTAATKRHKQDLTNLRRQFDTEYAALKRDLDDAYLGWRDEYHRNLNLADQLAAEQRRLDHADRVTAGLRGRVADLEAELEDYARAWGDVPQAFRTPVADLERNAVDDVWAPGLDPSPVLVGLIADAVKGEAPRLPDAWEPESTTQWFAKIQVPPEPGRRTGRKYKHRKAVGR